MSTAGSLLEWAPALRRGVRLGPRLLRGASYLHLIHDPDSGRTYEIGVREHFVFSRLDGRRTLAEVGEEYAAHFGRVLGEPGWKQLIRLLTERGLLEGLPARVAAPAAAAAVPSSPWRGRRAFGDPSRLLEVLHRRLRPVLRWYVLALPAVAVCAMELALAADGGALLRDVRDLAGRPLPGIAVLVGIFLFTTASSGLHELAHGLACRHFGGRSDAIGVGWRLPFVYFYCAVEDSRFFGPRRHRVITALAGVFVNLLVLLPLFACRTWAPVGDTVRQALSATLLLASLRALANLLPFPKLDGYIALSHALNVMDLADESIRFARRRGAGGYPGWARFAYLGYLLSLLVVWSVLILGGWLLAARALS
ncbi:peptidase M50 [Streptomyces sp. NPDC001250]|uniref:peptidase M50 n=1 Tax=unclassified Streptomyces TaxID=2593676 RepID=UPI00332F16E8